MEGASHTTRKMFLLVGHAAGESKDALRNALAQLCQAQGLTLGSLTASDGLAFIQAVANGCQVISLEESMPECPAAASFAATAALSGYALTIVTGSGKHYNAGMWRQLSQQGSAPSLCKLLCNQPGQEFLLAAAVVAPLLFRETIFGIPQQHSAGGLQLASAQPQQANANGLAPLMLTGQPHEAADASSGQTQQVLKTTPQHRSGHEQEQRADEHCGPPSSAGEQDEPRDACCVGKHAAQPNPQRKEPNAAEGGAALCEEDPAADKPDEQQQHIPDAEVPHRGIGQPTSGQTEVVDLISDSDDERADIPASQADVPKKPQSVPAKDGREEAPRGAAVRRSGRISSQCSDGSESEEQHRRVKRSKAWLSGCRKREAGPHPPMPKKSRLGPKQQLPAESAARQMKRKPVKAKNAAASGRKGAKKAKTSPAETGQHKEQQVRLDTIDTKANISARAGALSKAAEVSQDESSEWSSEPEGADQPLEQGDGMMQSGRTPVNSTPVDAAKAHAGNPPSSTARPAGRPLASAQHDCKTEADRGAAPVQHSTPGIEDPKAGTSPPQEPTSGTAPASMTQASSPARSTIPFSQADTRALLAAFELNRCSQAATQSPAKKYKRSDKGKEKVSEMPRDPQQPGPSNAIYCTPAGEVDDSEDDSFDLNTPPM